MVELDGDADNPIYISFGTYVLRDVPFWTVAPMGRDILPYRFEWMIFNQAHRVLTYDYLQLGRHSQSEQGFSQSGDVAALTRDIRNADIELYPSAPSIMIRGVPVSASFAIMQIFALHYYVGVAEDWRAEHSEPERTIVINRFRRFAAAVLWEYALALDRTVTSQAHQNYRVPVWPGAVINFIRLHRNLLRKEERANSFWKPLFSQVIY